MKLKRINQKFNTSLQDICKNLNGSLEELIQAYDREDSGWGCFVFSKEGIREYTFVNGDEENSECMDPEYGISYFIVRSEGAATKLVEFGIAQNGKTQNAEGPYMYKLDDRGDFIAYYHYGKYSGTDMAKWLEQVNASRINGESPTYTDPDGTKCWIFNGKFHREDGPAIEHADGSKVWYFNGKRHRVDGPAREWADGSKVWLLNGKLHRVDGPAVEWANGTKQWWLNDKQFTQEEWKAEVSKLNLKVKKLTADETVPPNFTGIAEWADGTKQWYLDGKRHRVDGPAIEWANGSKAWWLNGKIHRVDGPAREWADGRKQWFLNGKLHRVDGPAWEGADGAKEWWLNGKQFTQEEWKAEVSKLNLKVKKLTVDETVPPNFTGIAEWPDGSKQWYMDGKLHRVDGPARVWPNGTKQWYFNGELHREDGPAWERADGSKTWCFNGKLHREDGPAWEGFEGRKEWWLNGKQFTQEEWKAEVSKLNLKVKKLTADETVPPNFTGIAEWPDGRKEWWLNGKLHRVDGPAIEYADGSKQWLLNGKLHRVDGPAVEWANGTKQWWLNDKQFTQEEWKAEVSKRSKNCAPLTAAVASATIVGSVPTEQNCQTRVEKMSKAETIKTIVMSDGKMVAQRVAVEKIAKVLQGLIVEGITRNSKGKNKTVVKTQLGEFFNTDQGRAAIKFLVGCLAPFVKSHVPEKYHGVIDEIATEARVQGETTAMLNIIDMVQPMIAMLSSTVMDSLQTFVAADEKVRVELDPSTIPVEHQEVVFAAPTKAATA